MSESNISHPTPWEWCSVWDNESQFLTWLRGQLRTIWSNYPVRTEFLDASCTAVTQAMRETYGLHSQTKKAGQCVFCQKWFPKSKLEVDHIRQAGSMNSMEKIPDFLFGLLCSPDNLQLTCKPCHKIKSYAERQELSFQEAELEKKVIAWLKQHSVGEQKALLTVAGFSDDNIKNDKARRQAIKDLLSM